MNADKYAKQKEEIRKAIATARASAHPEQRLREMAARFETGVAVVESGAPPLLKLAGIHDDLIGPSEREFVEWVAAEVHAAMKGEREQ